MPAHYPEWPDGEQVQRYLEGYVTAFGLDRVLRLDTEVVSAELVDESSWRLTVRSPAGEETLPFDHLVVANGTFSRPAIPVLPGREAFERAGGKVCAVSGFADQEAARDRDVLVIGYGKSACDAAVAISDVAARTTLVARELLWKVPRKLAGVLNYKYLLLTRLGEGLFPYLRPGRLGRLAHGPGRRVPAAMLGSVQSLVVRQYRLDRLGLVPHGPYSEIARSTVSLATEGFYEAVAEGRLSVHRDAVVEELLVTDGRTRARLSTGVTVPADLIVCGTGFDQQVPFLAPEVIARIQDDRGNFTLYRQIRPPGVPALTFTGYNASFFSPLGCEAAAVWTAALLLGSLRLPPTGEMRAQVAEQLRWAERRTAGQHARGTNVVPFSMHNIDEILDDLGLNVGPLTRAKQWLLPVDPAAYQGVTGALLRRHGLG